MRVANTVVRWVLPVPGFHLIIQCHWLNSATIKLHLRWSFAIQYWSRVCLIDKIEGCVGWHTGVNVWDWSISSMICEARDLFLPYLIRIWSTIKKTIVISMLMTHTTTIILRAVVLFIYIKNKNKNNIQYGIFWSNGIILPQLLPDYT